MNTQSMDGNFQKRRNSDEQIPNCSECPNRVVINDLDVFDECEYVAEEL